MYPIGRYKHRLTHRQLYIDCYYIMVDKVSEAAELLTTSRRVSLHDEGTWVALPIVLKKALQQLARQIHEA